MLGIYYDNKTTKLYISAPMLSLEGFSISGLDIEGLLDMPTLLGNLFNTLNSSIDSINSGNLPNLASGQSEELSGFDKFVQSLIDLSTHSEYYADFNAAKFMILLAADRYAISLNIALINTILRAAGLNNIVIPDIGTLTLEYDRQDPVLMNMGYTAYRALVLRTATNEGEINEMNMTVHLGAVKLNFGNSTNSIHGPLDDIVTVGTQSGTYRDVVLEKFNDISNLQHIELNASIRLELATTEGSATDNPMINWISQLIGGLITGAPEDLLKINFNTTNDFIFTLNVGGKIYFNEDEWDKTQFMAEVLSKSSTSGDNIMILKLYYDGDDNIMYLDASGLLGMRTKILGLDLKHTILGLIQDVNLDLSSIGSSAIEQTYTQDSNSSEFYGYNCADCYARGSSYVSPGVLCDCYNLSAQDDGSALACGCTCPICIANGDCMINGVLHSCHGEGNSCAHTVRSPKINVRVYSYRNTSLSEGIHLELAINTNVIQQILYMVGVGDSFEALPLGVTMTLRANLNSGLEGFGLNVDFSTPDATNYLDIALTNFSVTNTISSTNYLSGLVRNQYGGISIGGILSGAGATGLIFNLLDGLDPNLAIVLGTNTTYENSGGTDVVGQNRKSALQVFKEYDDGEYKIKARINTQNGTLLTLHIYDKLDSFDKEILGIKLGNALIEGAHLPGWLNFITLGLLPFIVNSILNIIPEIPIELDLAALLAGDPLASGVSYDVRGNYYRPLGHTQGVSEVTYGNVLDERFALRKITVNLGNGNIADNGNANTLSLQENIGGAAYSNIIIELDPLVLGSILASLEALIVNELGFPKATKGKEFTTLLIQFVKDTVVDAIGVGGFLATVVNWFIGLLDNQLIAHISRLLPFPTVGANAPNGKIIVVLKDADISSAAGALDKIYLDISNASGEYYRILISNTGGVSISQVNESAGFMYIVDNQATTNMLPTTYITDVYNLDMDYNGVKDYMENLPEGAVVTMMDGNQDQVHITWSDQNILIDPTKVETYQVDGYGLNMHFFAKVEVVPEAVRMYERTLLFENAEQENRHNQFKQTSMIIDPAIGGLSSTGMIYSYPEYQLAGTIFHRQQYTVDGVVDPHWETKCPCGCGATVIPVVDVRGYGVPMVFESGINLNSVLPNRAYVYMVDGNYNRVGSTLFDSNSNVLKWDTSKVSTAYTGQQRGTVYLTYGSGAVKDITIPIPCSVSSKGITSYYFNEQDGYNTETGLLELDPYGDLKLPTSVYVSMGNEATARHYSIIWDTNTLLPTYNGREYKIGAYVGNSSVGYQRLENITVVIKPKILKSIDFGDFDATFDLYKGEDPRDVYNYPHIATVTFEDNSVADMVVSWSFAGVRYNYAGTKEYYAIARIGNKSGGYQYLEVPIEIIDTRITADRLVNLSNIVIDPFNTSINYYDAKNTSLYPDKLSVQFGPTDIREFNVEWKLDGLNLNYGGGTYYVEATLYRLNDNGVRMGNQIVSVPVEVINRTVVDVQNVFNGITEFDPYMHNVRDLSYYNTTPTIIFVGAPAQAMNVNWDLSGVSQNYLGDSIAGSNIAVIRIGNSISGYQNVSIPVPIKNRTVEEAIFSDYSFNMIEIYDEEGNYIYKDPMDSSNYEKSAPVRFINGEYSTLEVRWDLTALENVSFNADGNSVTMVTAFVGNMMGGFQSYQVPVRIYKSEVKHINNLADFVFDPFNNIDPRKAQNYPSTVTVTYMNNTMGIVDVVWDLSDVVENYKGYLGNTGLRAYAYIGNQVIGYKPIGGEDTMRDYFNVTVTPRIINMDLLDVTINVDRYSITKYPTSTEVTFMDGSKRIMPIKWVEDPQSDDLTQVIGLIGTQLSGYQSFVVEKQVANKVMDSVTLSFNLYDSRGNRGAWIYRKVGSEYVLVESNEVTIYVTEQGSLLNVFNNNYKIVIDPMYDINVLPSSLMAQFDDETNIQFASSGFKLLWNTSALSGINYGGATGNVSFKLGKGTIEYFTSDNLVIEVLDKTIATDSGVYAIYKYDSEAENFAGDLIDNFVFNPYEAGMYPNQAVVKTADGSYYLITTIWKDLYDRTNKLIEKTTTIGNARWGYQNIGVEVDHVQATVAYILTSVTVDPYYPSLPNTILAALKTESGELLLDDYGEVKIFELYVDWSRTPMLYSYEGRLINAKLFNCNICDNCVAGLECEEKISGVQIYVGNDIGGYAPAAIEIKVSTRIIEKLVEETYNINPYGSLSLPKTVSVIFTTEDGTRKAGDLNMIANIENAIAIDSNYQVSTVFRSLYEGGLFKLNVKVGSAGAGYQDMVIYLNVAPRVLTDSFGIPLSNVVSIKTGDKYLYKDGNIVAFTIDPYDMSTYPSNKVIVEYMTELGAIDTFELMANWNYANISYSYRGLQETGAEILIGNSTSAYQKLAVNIAINANVIELASTDIIFDPYVSLKEQLDTILYVDYFYNNDMSDSRKVSVAGWATNNISYNYQGGMYTIRVKVGDEFIGYQWVPIDIVFESRYIDSIHDYVLSSGNLIVGNAYGISVNKYAYLNYNEQTYAYYANGLSGQILNVILTDANRALLYTGALSEIEVLVGNSFGGYQAIMVPVTMLSMQITNVYTDANGINSINNLAKYNIIEMLDMPVFDSVVYVEFNNNTNELYVMDMVSFNLIKGSRYDVNNARVFNAMLTFTYANEYNSISYTVGGSDDYNVLAVYRKINSINPSDFANRTIIPYQTDVSALLKDMLAVSYESINIAGIPNGSSTLMATYFISINGQLIPLMNADGDIVEGLLSYQGAIIDVVVRFGNQLSDYQYFTFKWGIAQRIVSSIDDQAQASIVIDDAYRYIELGTSFYDSYKTSTLNVMLSNVQNPVTLNVLEGSWNFSAVVLDVNGGTYYATVKVGDAVYGYQTLNIPVIVSPTEVNSYTFSGATAAQVYGNSITIGINQLFKPFDFVSLNLTLANGSNVNMSYDISGEEWNYSAVRYAKTGIYNAYVNLFGVTLSHNVVVDENIVITSNSIPEYTAVRKGEKIFGTGAYPTSLTESYMYYDTASSITMDINWTNIPSLNVSDTYYAIGVITNGVQGVSWTVVMEVFVYNSYIRALTTSEPYAYQIEQGAKLSISNLPYVSVYTYTSSKSIDVRVNWEGTEALNTSADIGTVFTISGKIRYYDIANQRYDALTVYCDVEIIDNITQYVWLENTSYLYNGQNIAINTVVNSNAIINLYTLKAGGGDTSEYLVEVDESYEYYQNGVKLNSIRDIGEYTVVLTMRVIRNDNVIATVKKSVTVFVAENDISSSIIMMYSYANKIVLVSVKDNMAQYDLTYYKLEGGSYVQIDELSDTTGTYKVRATIKESIAYYGVKEIIFNIA